ncbi:helix-turn-helix domain-containing GNAT family N-acetyltransferase [Fodinicola acaciae]|uniref:helix-turn-helix domain-containing GNAT family N-acetyltransferase n=1 Tax=Fodinicola acaciae TaxID=2681555 RepID=UPI0013D0587A|nr:GNAT family N-acetyltransferase [Fodinicola acaciae]
MALSQENADAYAASFGALADATRVRLLHSVAASGETTVEALADELGIGPAACAGHLRTLADVGFVGLHNESVVCRRGFPQVTTTTAKPLRLPDDVNVRPLLPRDWPDVRRIYAEGIATGLATFETDVPSRAALDAKWLPDQRWVAEVDGAVAGWAALTAASSRPCYAGVAETSVYIADGMRGRGVGKALLHQQVSGADAAGIWTLQSAIFAENTASLALHHAAGFRTVGIRERIARLNGRWHDTVFIERRAPSNARVRASAPPADQTG